MLHLNKVPKDDAHVQIFVVSVSVQFYKFIYSHCIWGKSNKLMISRLQLVLFLDLDHDFGPLLWFKQNYFLICYESKTWRQIYPSCFTLWRGRRVVNSNRGGQDELGQEPGLHQNSEWGDHSGTLFQPFGQQRAFSLLFWKRKRVTEWFPRTIFWKKTRHARLPFMVIVWNFLFSR